MDSQSNAIAILQKRIDEYKCSETPLSTILIFKLDDANDYDDKKRQLIRHQIMNFVYQKLQCFDMQLRGYRGRIVDVKINFAAVDENNLKYFYSHDGHSDPVKVLYVAKFVETINQFFKTDMPYRNIEADEKNRLSLTHILTNPIAYFQEDNN